MEVALDTPRPHALPRADALAVAAIASLGAGAVHAAAMGVHNEHDQAVLTFALVAAFQLGWGAVAMLASRRWVAIAGALGNAVLVGGWIQAKVAGIGFIDGLEEPEAMQWPDAVAAALAALAVVGAVAWLLRGQGFASDVLFVRLSIAVVAVVTLSGMVSAANGHAHAAGGHDAAAATGAEASGSHPASGAAAGAVAIPYDPTKPIDLSGTDGVTPEQQAQAENLLASTLVDLPQWSDPAVAEAQGWKSINDSVTGYEHYINQSLMNDGRVLDSDYPESLVYQVDRSSGKKELVAAMYMLEPGATLDTVPDIGGKLMQWHIHNNLCFTAGPQPRVAGITNADGTCNAPLVKAEEVPMVHVWITPHPCGPFAALEGIAGGQVKEGEERLCDTAHGSHE